MSPQPRIAVCPGSYDPITNGHVDVITRAAELFDEVIVAVIGHSRKSNALFSLEERLEFVRISTEHLPRVRTQAFDTLIVEFARTQGAAAIVKGLRAISDFEYEFEMNQLNRKQAPQIESLYIMASPEYSFLSSSGVKELANLRRRRLPVCPRARRERACRKSCGASESPQRRAQCFASACRPSTLTPMDVLVLIDKLDDLVHSAKQVPLTDQVRVDKEEIYEILDQMRATIPEEIKQARWIVKERQEMLAEAKREAERIVKDGRERAERLIADEEIVKAAERAAEDIIEDARAQEREIRLGAEDYADEILDTLETNLTKFINAVQRGRERLAGRDEQVGVS